MESLKVTKFEHFYAAYYKQCLLFAKSYVHDDWVAEDISSGALIKLWEMSREKTVDNPKVILFTILKNKALDYLKHQNIKESVLSSLSDIGQRELEIRISTLEASNPEKVFDEDIQHIIRQSFNKLTKQTREIFKMSRIENLSRKEISDKIGISVKGVDYHISKVLKLLKYELRNYFPIILFMFF